MQLSDGMFLITESGVRVRMMINEGRYMDTQSFIYEFLKSTNTDSLIWRYYINEFEPGWKMEAPHKHKAMNFNLYWRVQAF